MLKCQLVSLLEGKLVKCGGEIKPVIMCEYGERVMYEACQRCHHNQSLTPVVLSENILGDSFEVGIVHQALYHISSKKAD